MSSDTKATAGNGEDSGAILTPSLAGKGQGSMVKIIIMKNLAPFASQPEVQTAPLQYNVYP